MDITQILLPQSLTIFEVNSSVHDDISLVDPTYNLVQGILQQGTYQTRLVLMVYDDTLVVNFLTGEWCRHLRTLELRRGIEVFTRLLAHEDDIEIQEQTQRQQQGQKLSAVAAVALTVHRTPEYAYVSQNFINARLPFATTFQSLFLDGFEFNASTKLQGRVQAHQQSATVSSSAIGFFYELPNTQLGRHERAPVTARTVLEGGLAVHFEEVEEARQWQFWRLEDVDIQCTEYEEDSGSNWCIGLFD
ncbi:hypothetical protein BGZ51_003390 [Haplosporangium sp. Z 767]|nr:hypothetical protein BGZ51_003390 [Haplosporangium sp. Z 767]KAF9185022.1 hypothetical protein BGZ50_003347 [Haplosporangium sp. Z 11]